MENESLKQDIKHLEREELERLLIEEIEQSDKSYANMVKKQEKIDKAIEYIEKNIDNTGWLEIGRSNVKELLEILRGKENE